MNKLKHAILNYSKYILALICLVLVIILSINSFTLIIDFLNKNSGAIIAIFTGIYVMGTFLMWFEMKKSRERLDEANIQITLEPQERYGQFFDLVIENLSNVPVYELKLSIEPKGLKTKGDRKLEDLNLFKKVIPVFGVNQKIRTLALFYIDFIHSDQPKQIKFIAEYKTRYKKIKRQEYEFDLEIYFEMSYRSRKDLNDIAEQFEILNKKLDKLGK